MRLIISWRANKALFDENDWAKNKKKVVFFSNSISSLILDDSSTKLPNDIEQRFKKIKIKGDNFKFEAEIKGKVSQNKNRIIINLE